MATLQCELDAAVRILRAHGARSVYLFGSALNPSAQTRDLDIGCEGLPPEKFFMVLAELSRTLSRDVDLVALEDDHPRVRVIRKRARVLYDAG